MISSEEKKTQPTPKQKEEMQEVLKAIKGSKNDPEVIEARKKIRATILEEKKSRQIQPGDSFMDIII